MLDMCFIIKAIESLSWICFFHAWKKVPNIFSQMVMYHDSKQTKYLKQIQNIQDYSHILPQWYIPLDTLWFMSSLRFPHHSPFECRSWLSKFLSEFLPPFKVRLVGVFIQHVPVFFQSHAIHVHGISGYIRWFYVVSALKYTIHGSSWGYLEIWNTVPKTAE